MAQFFFGVSINSQKPERRQYPATLTEQAWQIKDLLWRFSGYIACGNSLPASVANHIAGSAPLLIN